MAKYRAKEYAQMYREENPDLDHLDDADILFTISKDQPELMEYVDRDDLALTMKDVRKKQISKERQKNFKSLSGFSRFGTGAEYGVKDLFMGVKQLFGGDTEKYKVEKQEYQDASEGDFASGLGEVSGAIASTAPLPGLTGVKLASKVASPLIKTAIGLGAGGIAGAGVGATEFVDEGETREKNTLYGSLFGAGGSAAGMLVKKIGTKAFNALKGKMANASDEEVLNLAKKYDIPLTIGDVTGKGRAVEKELEKIPVVGIGGFREKGSEKVQTAIKKKAGELDSDWDETLQQSLKDQSKAGKEQAKINYDKVSELSKGATVKPSSTLEKIQEVEKDFISDVPMDEANKTFVKNMKLNVEEGTRDFASLRKTRTDLGKAINKANSTGDRDFSRQLGIIKEGVEKDLERISAGSPELKDAYKKATDQYKTQVIPYTDKTIINAIKSDTPDELFDKFIKKDKGDRAKNFYNLLDDKGKKALKEGFLSKAIDGATNEDFTSPAKLAGYLERLSNPAESMFKGADLDEVQGFAKIMRHAERYGQLNEAPSNGMQLIPLLKGSALIGSGAGLMTSPVATGATIISSALLGKLVSLMKTKGVKFSLASSDIGSKELEKKITEILSQLPKATAQAGKEEK